MVHYSTMGKEKKKINTSMNLDEDLLKWVDSQIAKKRFAHRTHAVEYALQKLKEKTTEID
jgi:Arc/MetJ-type ribon-helix-helix transcriptional regulator